MNLNKNNIKFYFSENKMKKMIENLQNNLENDEELRISIEKYKKDSKPQSAKNGLFSFTGTNNSTNQSFKNEDKLTNNISDIDNIIKKQKTKSFENLSSQKESENSFDSLKFNNKKINKQNTFFQYPSKHSYLTNLYLKNNNTTIEYIPFNKKMPNEVNSNRNNIKNNNLNIHSIDNLNIKNINNNDNNNDLNNQINFPNVNNNISIKNSFNSYINNVNNTYKNFPIIRPMKSKINKTQKVVNLPEIHSKLTNKSFNNEIIENSIKSFDNENKLNLFLENSKNNIKKIKKKKSKKLKVLKENDFSPVIKKIKYEKMATLSYQKKRRSLESKNEFNIEKNIYQINIDMNQNDNDNYIDKTVNEKFLDYFKKNLISKNKELNINKYNKCIKIINKKIDFIFYENEKKINILEQKITNKLNNKLLNDQNLLNKKLDFKIENNASIRENKVLFYNYIKILNKENEINNEIFIQQNIKTYILNNYYDIIEDIFNYCFKINNRHKKHIFFSYINKVLKINKIVNKNLHSLTYNKKNNEQNYKKKSTNDDIIKNLYSQAISKLYNKSYLEEKITRDINHQLYKKYKFINFVENMKKIFPITRSFNKKVTLHKNSMKNFYKHNSKQIKSQFGNPITSNQQLSKTSPNLNNNTVSTFKKQIYSNLNMNEIIKTYEKKKSYKLTKEIFQDSITKNILAIPPKKIIRYKSKFDINMKETYSNKDILIPDFNTEKNMINNKEFETISSSNKYIIQIQTDNSKPEEISNLGNDIMKILKYYIKNDNEILAIKIIKDYIDVINLNYKNKEGMTLLLLAIKNNCSDKLIQFLLDKGADPNVFDVRILYNLNYNIIYYFSSKEILHYIMLFLIIILKLLIC